MLDNSPFRSHQHKDLTIEGYSRAAVQSYWRIPELKLGFDLGAQPWDFMGTPTWFVSHTHLDHVAALPVYVARRRMMKMDPPTIYLPEHAIELVQHVLKAFQRLDSTRADGLGIGLFVVRRAVELLGHRIEVSSAVSRGSRFSVLARASRRPRR